MLAAQACECDGSDSTAAQTLMAGTVMVQAAQAVMVRDCDGAGSKGEGVMAQAVKAVMAGESDGAGSTDCDVEDGDGPGSTD